MLIAYYLNYYYCYCYYHLLVFLEFQKREASMINLGKDGIYSLCDSRPYRYHLYYFQKMNCCYYYLSLGLRMCLILVNFGQCLMALLILEQKLVFYYFALVFCCYKEIWNISHMMAIWNMNLNLLWPFSVFYILFNI